MITDVVLTGGVFVASARAATLRPVTSLINKTSGSLGTAPIAAQAPADPAECTLSVQR